MRTPDHDTVADPSGPSPAGDEPEPSTVSPPEEAPRPGTKRCGGRRGSADAGAAAEGEWLAGPDGPVRSCILTRERAPRDALLRLVLAPDGRVLPDVRAKAAGRGAWIGVARAGLETAIAKGKLRGALARAFKTGELTVPDDLPDLIETALSRHALDRLGLEARAGTIATGSDRIEDAARAGRLHALYHAADAGEDGRRRLAQAWRVGQGDEGSRRQGLALPVGRPILSLALGRENVVHIGVTDRAAAGRVGEALDRWRHFIGPDPSSTPCGTAPHGASALPIEDAAIGRRDEDTE